MAAAGVLTAMNHHALVVGVQIGGLAGVDTDARAMKAALEGRGFKKVDLLLGADATREGIEAGFRRLIDATRPGDAAVFYYAGHGARFVSKDKTAGAPGHPRTGQLIVPYDYRATKKDDFRGITSWELSLWLTELTAGGTGTDNVVMLFDCCFAAHMTRGRGAVRGLPHPCVNIESHLAALKEQGARFDDLDPLGNRHAVRLFASGPCQLARERPLPDGRHAGVFTEALLRVLAEAGDAALTWNSVWRAVRDRVTGLYPDQWPELSGPGGRELFTTYEPARGVAVPIYKQKDRVLLRAGRLHGVQPGSTYHVLPAGSIEDTPARRLAVAILSEAGAIESVLVLGDWQVTPPDLPEGALAFPRSEQIESHPVTVVGDGREAMDVRARIVEAPRVRLSIDADVAAPLVSVTIAGGGAVIADDVGPLAAPLPIVTEDQRRRLVDFLGELAIARSLRLLVGSFALPADAIGLSWGVLVNGELQYQADDAMIGLGDRVCIRVENRTTLTLYVHVFDVGVRGKITRLTSDLTGLRIPSGEDQILGDVPGRRLVGLGLTWPDGLGREQPRREELYAIATTAQADLGTLETEHRAVRDGTARGPSPLAALLHQLRRGGTRDLSAGTIDGFAVVRAAFFLQPVVAALASPGFLADDNPTGTQGALALGAWPDARPARLPSLPRTIAVRLDEVVIHADRVFDRADVRIDALVCTRTDARARPYVVETLRFPRVDDADHLPLARALLFHGEVVDFVDLCVWISRDRSDAGSLFDLLAQRRADPAIAQGLAALRITGAPWVSAVGASLGLARLAHDVLAAATGSTIGLYRTSFLAGEQFGVGRHPVTGLRRAQDFSFALAIDDVAP